MENKSDQKEHGVSVFYSGQRKRVKIWKHFLVEKGSILAVSNIQFILFYFIFPKLAEMKFFFA